MPLSLVVSFLAGVIASGLYVFAGDAPLPLRLADVVTVGIGAFNTVALLAFVILLAAINGRPDSEYGARIRENIATVAGALFISLIFSLYVLLPEFGFTQ